MSSFSCCNAIIIQQFRSHIWCVGMCCANFSVGLACQAYASIWRRARGMYFSALDVGNMHSMVSWLLIDWLTSPTVPGLFTANHSLTPSSSVSTWLVGFQLAYRWRAGDCRHRRESHFRFGRFGRKWYGHSNRQIIIIYCLYVNVLWCPAFFAQFAYALYWTLIHWYWQVPVFIRPGVCLYWLMLVRTTINISLIRCISDYNRNVLPEYVCISAMPDFTWLCWVTEHCICICMHAWMNGCIRMIITRLSMNSFVQWRSGT
jgi:hypothetical protein